MEYGLQLAQSLVLLACTPKEEACLSLGLGIPLSGWRTSAVLRNGVLSHINDHSPRSTNKGACLVLTFVFSSISDYEELYCVYWKLLLIRGSIGGNYGVTTRQHRRLLHMVPYWRLSNKQLCA